jgi:hypothetical protein
MLDIWPVLPLVIEYHRMDTWEVQDDVIAALEHHDRVRQISLGAIPNPVWETLAAAMQVPFPELTSLSLWSGDGFRACSSRFVLGWICPTSANTQPAGIPFPAVRNLLLSASDLVHLDLWHLPHSGYISPESMVACLSSLNRLESLSWIPIASISPRPTQSTSTDTRRPPRSHQTLTFAGAWATIRKTSRPHRYPRTQSTLHGILHGPRL